MNGTELKAIRKKLGISQEELSELLGYTMRRVGNWERGDYDVPRVVELVMKLLEASSNIVRERVITGEL